jgi:transposase
VIPTGSHLLPAQRNSNRRSHMADRSVIRAVIDGAEQCTALGQRVRASAPVLALCRELIAAGHDPKRSLHAYRDGVLVLRVRSIGEAARLRVATHGVGFEADKGCTAVSPMRFPDRAAA